MARPRLLHDGWTVAAVPGQQVPHEVAGRRVPATVPGCVHTDLLAAGLIPDPYLDDNELRLRWVGHSDWLYETTFEWSGDPSAGRTDLVCAGLDTVAAVSLNDVEVGRTANMHRGYRFDVGGVLRAGENRLRVRFDSAYRYARQLRDQLGDRPRAYPEAFNFIRKMACNFGWDWGPELVTAGIWQPIALHTWDEARLAAVRPLVSVEDGRGRVRLHVDLKRAERAERAGRAGDAGAPLEVVATVHGVRVATTVEPGGDGAVLDIDVPDPELWWPRGYGAQTRHPLEVTLSAGGRALDTWRRLIGFRSLRLDTGRDEHGTAFTVVVNDIPIVARGVNWIPDDVFVTRVDRARYRHRLRQAAQANVNFVRVWGGGRYEADEFYDVCDELGLLVGQDFLFACAAYPEEEPLAAEVAAEAREQVTRLAGRPSLAMWVGNNENLWGYHDWDWQPQLDGRTWGAGYYFDVLPRIVAQLDPATPYWPGSPYSGDRELAPNDPAHGSTHIWDVWNQRDYLGYRDYRPRFVAEFGYQAPPAYATLRRSVGDEPLAPDSPGMRHHQKAGDGDGKLSRGLQAHFPVPRDFDDWHYLTQVNQARAITVGVEHFRSLRPLCMGSVVWQLNDCWPVTSWAAVDGDGRRKPLWYALRRCYADRLLTIQPRDGGLALVAVNDGATDWSVPATVTRLDLAGRPQAKTSARLRVPPHQVSTVLLPDEVSTSADPRGELLVAEANGTRAWWFFAEDRDIAYPPPDFHTVVSPVPGGLRVRVSAHTLLRELTLFPDRLDPAATVDDVMVNLLPGEAAVFLVTTAAELDPAALTSRPVLRCVNDLGTPARP